MTRTSRPGDITSEFSFCETATASSISPWHIRKLTVYGKKYGGGADTPALCGIKVSWDLEVKIDDLHLQHACKKCVSAFQEVI